MFVHSWGFQKQTWPGSQHLLDEDNGELFEIYFWLVLDQINKEILFSRKGWQKGWEASQSNNRILFIIINLLQTKFIKGATSNNGSLIMTTYTNRGEEKNTKIMANCGYIRIRSSQIILLLDRWKIYLNDHNFLSAKGHAGLVLKKHLGSNFELRRNAPKGAVNTHK